MINVQLFPEVLPFRQNLIFSIVDGRKSAMLKKIL